LPSWKNREKLDEASPDCHELEELKNDLVDELKIFPVAIGGGRNLFADGAAYAVSR